MPIQLIAAPHTPFDATGNLVPEIVQQQAAHFAATNVAGVFICGSTGEGVSLTARERESLAEAWVAAAKPLGLRVLVHVGHNSLREAARLAAHAASLGVDGVAAMATSYFKPTAVEDLMSYLAPISSACASTPFYFYDIPSMTGVRISTTDLVQQLSQQLPNFAGIKYTKDDLLELQECLHLADGNWEIFFGCDEMLLAGYVLGATSAVGSTYNFAPQLYHRMVEAFDRGEAAEARRLQLLSVELVRACQRFGYAASAKTAMQLVGIDCGPVRPPLHNLSAAQTSQLLDELEGLLHEFLV